MEVYPRATEKSYLEQAKRTYIFLVPADASKQAAKQAIEEQFNVTVTSIRVLTRKGKATRFSKGKHAYPGTTYRRDKKYAYVTLKEGDKIKIFEEEEKKEDKKADKKAEKDAKKSAKAAAKAAEKKGDK
ncbi:50S ribosomal protein L23 [Candidatus Saccharibacteria bacterium]|nr:50S ribosomal protein L23 [Candidatus Saccharibacteria bacterium]MBQ3469672.1 50S ribosomal protein L23 [Candidatus Saccharibacteria bacterium]